MVAQHMRKPRLVVAGMAAPPPPIAADLVKSTSSIQSGNSVLSHNSRRHLEPLIPASWQELSKTVVGRTCRVG